MTTIRTLVISGSRPNREQRDRPSRCFLRGSGERERLQHGAPGLQRTRWGGRLPVLCSTCLRRSLLHYGAYHVGRKRGGGANAETALSARNCCRSAPLRLHSRHCEKVTRAGESVPPSLRFLLLFLEESVLSTSALSRDPSVLIYLCKGSGLCERLVFRRSFLHRDRTLWISTAGPLCSGS